MTRKVSRRKLSRPNKIGIIGIGFVGGAVKNYFEKQGAEVFVYDKFKNLGSPAEVNRADVVFICVPTPFNVKSGFDLSIVKEAVGLLKGSKTVVIKSTVVPGATEALQECFPRHKFLFNPEFLREVTAFEDLIHPDRQILGITSKSGKEAEKVMRLLPKAPYQGIMSSAEAEMVKYMCNSFLALKVVFANEYYELCKRLGLDYEKIKTAVGHDKRITHSHLGVLFGDYRGYGGRCFPKDVNAIIQFGDRMKVDMKLLKTMREINRELLSLSGLSERSFLENADRS